MKATVVARRRRAVPELRAVAIALAAGAITAGYFLFNVLVGTSVFVPTGGPVFPMRTLWEILALYGLQTVFLFWHRRFPVATFVAVMLATLYAVVLLPDRNLVEGFTLLYACYNLVVRTSWQRWGWLVPLAAVADIALQLVLSPLPPFPIVLEALGAVTLRSLTSYLEPVLVGLLVASHQRRVELAEEVARGEWLRQEAQVAATLAEERNGMARELHDVAAQYLASGVTQLEAAMRVIDHDPAAASVFLGRIQHDNQLALANLREVISVLRADVPADAPNASLLTRLPELVASIETTYPGVRLTVDGDVHDLSPAMSLACYRIIQESLSNARKHAPGADVEIRLERGQGELTVLVHNSAPTGRPEKRTGRGGYGLLGMRERAARLGGWLDSAATSDGGWETRAVIPLSGDLVAV